MEAAFDGAAAATLKAKGEQARFNTEMTNLKIAVGESIAPMRNALLGFFADVAASSADALEKVNEFKSALEKKQNVDSGAEKWSEGLEGDIERTTNRVEILKGAIEGLEKQLATDKAKGIIDQRAIDLIDRYNAELIGMQARQKYFIEERWTLPRSVDTVKRLTVS